jgi:RNA polymerase sigma-70 factor (ECF subfamily)
MKDRQILWLAHVEQHSHREVARILSLREASVRVLLLRARRRLAALLATEGIGPEVLS